MTKFEKRFTPEFVENQRRRLIALDESIRCIMNKDSSRTLVQLQKDVSRVRFAVKRIDEGQYGLCVHCGVPIELDRLDSTPETPFCAECQVDVNARKCGKYQ